MVNGVKGNQIRPVLNEVTTTAVNRKVCCSLSVIYLGGLHSCQDPVSKLIGKEKEEAGLKRGRSNSSVTTAQRVPLGPGRAQVAPPVANAINARAPLIRTQRQIPVLNNRRISRVVPEPVIVAPQEEDDEDMEDEMDVEEDDEVVVVECEAEAEESLLIGEQEVEAMVGVQDSDEEEVEETAKVAGSKPPRVWPEVSTDRAMKYQREVQAIREVFEDEIDMYDTTMVSEYADEIFDYMCELEVRPSHLIPPFV